MVISLKSHLSRLAPALFGLAAAPIWAADAGLPPNQYLPLEPPMRIVVTVEQQAKSAEWHATLAKYGLKCGNPACPVCYPPSPTP
ncbi:MAG: hypothetical protein JO171_02775 [Paludibacterium sp.]|uniref:hypothetical protein n=1 Tax=Paludibacterium sp. TaxID=1917523 RepID=UPI0025CC4C78|nr:hypothetical protein [Paludibacterium sp.]MBV8046049.1 hypothetical protein [Paludibacterium sp.]MBV8646138.1 hypothetical protein [Paludibacterium sp.]